jgi:hypothetical protein
MTYMQPLFQNNGYFSTFLYHILAFETDKLFSYLYVTPSIMNKSFGLIGEWLNENVLLNYLLF